MTIEQQLDSQSQCAPRISTERADAERAIALLTRAMLHLAENQRLQAQPLVAEARARCAALASPATLATLCTLEGQLTARPIPPELASLTRRERDVLGLVARGLRDAEVADRLCLSTRTITTHLTSIYAKLAVSSRTAAVRIALEHNLV